MTRTPKESFLLTGKAKEFGNIAASEAFETACDYALLQLQSEMLPNLHPNLPTDPYVGLDANAQMHGARRLLDILRSLHEPTVTKPPTKRPTPHYDNERPRTTPDSND